MKRSGVLKLAIVGIALGAVVAAALPRARTFVRSLDPDASLRLQDGRLIGEVHGHVAAVDPERRNLTISVNRLGLQRIPLGLDEETTITVQGKFGGLGDLWTGLPVRVTYELRDGFRTARSITVWSGDAAAASERPAAASVPPLPTPAEPSQPAISATAAPAAAAAAVPPAPPSVQTLQVTQGSAGLADGPAAPVRSSTAQPIEGAGARRAIRVGATPPRGAGPVTPPEHARPTLAPSRPPAVGERAAANGGVPGGRASSAQGGEDDGSAAIDWLLGERRR
ncbi:MAG TPA: hypothetical protein VFJ24_02540 [Gaiellales bacterium]|nr:hypothetical protein [Gaiellales bacterium]